MYLSKNIYIGVLLASLAILLACEDNLKKDQVRAIVDSGIAEKSEGQGSIKLQPDDIIEAIQSQEGLSEAQELLFKDLILIEGDYTEKFCESQISSKKFSLQKDHISDLKPNFLYTIGVCSSEGKSEESFSIYTPAAIPIIVDGHKEGTLLQVFFQKNGNPEDTEYQLIVKGSSESNIFESHWVGSSNESEHFDLTDTNKGVLALSLPVFESIGVQFFLRAKNFDDRKTKISNGIILSDKKSKLIKSLAEDNIDKVEDKKLKELLKLAKEKEAKSEGVPLTDSNQEKAADSLLELSKKVVAELPKDKSKEEYRKASEIIVKEILKSEKVSVSDAKKVLDEKDSSDDFPYLEDDFEKQTNKNAEKAVEKLASVLEKIDNDKKVVDEKKTTENEDNEFGESSDVESYDNKDTSSEKKEKITKTDSEIKKATNEIIKDLNKKILEQKAILATVEEIEGSDEIEKLESEVNEKKEQEILTKFKAQDKATKIQITKIIVPLILEKEEEQDEENELVAESEIKEDESKKTVEKESDKEKKLSAKLDNTTKEVKKKKIGKKKRIKLRAKIKNFKEQKVQLKEKRIDLRAKIKLIRKRLNESKKQIKRTNKKIKKINLKVVNLRKKKNLTKLVKKTNLQTLRNDRLLLRGMRNEYHLSRKDALKEIRPERRSLKLVTNKIRRLNKKIKTIRGKLKK